ncbi:MAG: hypothetical protein L0241_16555 [Planctomycetia bacterium]|nr:hypothetical protein [Planctomycetia bacterium]
MYPSLVLAATLTAPAAPIPRDTVPNTPGPAPIVLTLKADAGGSVRIIGNSFFRAKITNQFFVVENNKQVMKQVDQEITNSNYFNKTLNDLTNAKFTTADGTPLTVNEATSRVKAGATVLISRDGKPISPGWLKAVRGDTVVILTDEFAYAQFTWGGPPYPLTPAPRLAMLGADDSGKIMTSVTSSPNQGGVYYGGDVIWGKAMRGRGGLVVGGGDVVDFGGGYYGGPQTAGTITTKPLAEVKFDAYDLTGKRISRTTALKRLQAGGLVLMAGDNRFPDESYLKSFSGDIMVLVSPELVLPTAVKPLPKDVKINPPKDVEVPADQPLIRPGVIRGGGVKILPVAPPAEKPAKQEEKPKPEEKKPEQNKKPDVKRN